jgi:peptidoglycan/xylan/chitin deacetylase (PgdA/CDA1 family)
MMNIYLTIFFCFFGPIELSAKEISISFDDAPNNGSQYYSGIQRTNALVKSLNEAKVSRAAFYLNPVRMKSSEYLERVKSYALAGHALGNHSYDHPNLKDVGADAFIENIQKAHSLIKGLDGFKSLFRYPFLSKGKTFEEHRKVSNALSELKYQDACITIDNFDWYMDSLFQKALKEKKKINFKKLKAAYVEILMDSINFYDKLAIKVIGRSPKHVLLLHENDLNALFLSNLIQALRENGWKIITPEDAYSDPIWKRTPKTLHHGDGRIAALANEAQFSGIIRDKFQNAEAIDAYFESKNIFK